VVAAVVDELPALAQREGREEEEQQARLRARARLAPGARALPQVLRPYHLPERQHLRSIREQRLRHMQCPLTPLMPTQPV
jgi:hypothetical protein